MKRNACYPNTSGVPHVVAVGSSKAGKSSMEEKVMRESVRKAVRISGEAAGQTTLIPADFFLNEGLGDQTFLRIHFHPLSGAWRMDAAALQSAVIHTLLEMVEQGNTTGIAIGKQRELVESGRYAQKLCGSTSGYVRLEEFAGDERFGALLRDGVLLLLEGFDQGEFDRQTGGKKDEKQKLLARREYLLEMLNWRWGACAEAENNALRDFLDYTEEQVWARLEEVLGKGPWNRDEELTLELDLKQQGDGEVLGQLMNPHRPFSLVISRYELACGISRAVERYLEPEGRWRWKGDLPFRLVLTDTAGLTQQSSDIDDLRRLLAAALSENCDGIFLMIPVDLSDVLRDRLASVVSMREEVGRALTSGQIPIFLALSRADEGISSRFDPEEEEEEFGEEMRQKLDALRNRKEEEKKRFRASEVRLYSNQYRKIKIYVEELQDEEVRQAYRQELPEDMAVRYVVDMTARLQEKILAASGGEVIFLRGEDPAGDIPRVELDFYRMEETEAVQNQLVQRSGAYHVDGKLHWKTARAFWNSVRSGVRFDSRAVVNAQIHIYVDGDVEKAVGDTYKRWTDEELADHITLRNVRTDPDSLRNLAGHLERALNRQGNDQQGEVRVEPTEAGVKVALARLARQYFFGQYEYLLWRFRRQLIRNLSYGDQKLHDQLNEAFYQNYWDWDRGVKQVLACYQEIYREENFAAYMREYIFNGLLSDHFNRLFFPV